MHVCHCCYVRAVCFGVTVTPSLGVAQLRQYCTVRGVAPSRQTGSYDVTQSQRSNPFGTDTGIRCGFDKYSNLETG